MRLADHLDRLTHITEEDNKKRLGWCYAEAMWIIDEFEKDIMVCLTKAELKRRKEDAHEV